MPATTNKGLEVQTTGTNAGTWGSVLNNQMTQYVDQMLGGITTVALSGTDYTMSAGECRNAALRMTGTLLKNITVSTGGNLLVGFLYWENLTSGNFSVAFSNGAGSVTLPQSRRGVMWVDSNGPRIMGIAGSTNADPIPAGTLMLFMQGSVPAGWTLDTTFNEHAIRIGTTGAVQTGSVNYTTLFARTATDSHILTLAQIPSHQHDYQVTTFSAAAINNSNTVGVGLATSQTGVAGGGLGHEHYIDMRVKTVTSVVGIRAA